MHHQTWWVSMMLHRMESWEWDRGNEIRACCCHWVYFVLQIKDKLICPDEVVLAGIHGCLQQAGSGCGIRSAAKEPHPHDHRKHYFMDAGLKNLEHDFNALPPKPSVGEPHSLLGELHCLELHCTTGTEPVCGRNQRSVGYTSKSRRYFQPSNLLYPTTTCVATSTELHPRTTSWYSATVSHPTQDISLELNYGTVFTTSTCGFKCGEDWSYTDPSSKHTSGSYCMYCITAH